MNSVKESAVSNSQMKSFKQDSKDTHNTIPTVQFCIKSIALPKLRYMFKSGQTSIGTYKHAHVIMWYSCLFNHHTCKSFAQQFFWLWWVFSVTGATKQAHKSTGLWQLVSANGRACRAVDGGVLGDSRASIPITDSVGGVTGFGGVSEEYGSTAAHCTQNGE